MYSPVSRPLNSLFPIITRAYPSYLHGGLPQGPQVSARMLIFMWGLLWPLYRKQHISACCPLCLLRIYHTPFLLYFFLHSTCHHLTYLLIVVYFSFCQAHRNRILSLSVTTIPPETRWVLGIHSLSVQKTFVEQMTIKKIYWFFYI